ncbi:ExeA family protein [Hydrogenophaga sp.]|uniref:ExeA family protein n=1 Tax=Hydrogenophaga sp. TaxID=1904254 RepID=UPI002613ECB8|nr:ExeA family protein [Hydrogenophaga sp.]MDM7950497.1 AAA family ATPase [Hydrogenophaga sp.]
MYAGHFGLKHTPFSIAPDPRYLFMSERHREALAHLLYGIEGGGGFVLLTGEIGAGKTTICRCFLEQIPPHCRVAYIFNPKLTVGDLLKTICNEFHIEVKHEGIGPATIKDYLDPLNAYLLSSHAAGQHNILIIDEAQNLTSHVLEQLRLLTNLETSERKLLQIILIGQPELRKMLARPELEQLAQRVIARFHLGALTEAETRHYIRHRLAVAGLKGPAPFTDSAVKRIHTLTQGVPRRINLICDRALLGAYAGGLDRVDRSVVDKAAAEVFESPAVRPPAPPASRRATRRLGTLALGALGGALLTAALVGLWSATRQSAPTQLAAPAVVEPPAANAAVPAAPSTSTVTAAPVSSSEPALSPPIPGLPPASALLRSERAGVRELGPLWGQSLPDADPCARAEREQMQCFTTSRMTLHGMRQLDRPALLALRLPGQPRGWALITQITSETATLSVGNDHWLVPLTALADVWRGDYTTLWRLPPGQDGALRRATDGTAAAWVSEQLEGMKSRGELPATAGTMREQVEAFQRARGLEVDGIAGAMTIMLMNRAVSRDEPRLTAAAP